jgi:hypothetical protein
MNSENYFMNQDSKLTLGLSILFVDIEFGRGRLEYDQHSRFFLSDSNFWQQFQRFGTNYKKSKVIYYLKIYISELCSGFRELYGQNITT